MLASVKALFASVVDYAGLFPPAKLGIREAMANYVRDQMAPHAWMLDRFVLPASRLNEFEALLPTFPLEDGKTRQWPISVLISGDLELEIESVRSRSVSARESRSVYAGEPLNERDKIAVTALEFPPLPPREIDRVFPRLPAGVDSFFEIPFSENLEAYLAVLRHTGASAKIRTGGTSVEAFPSITELCRCIFSFAEARIPFKATAGLHHPLPAKHRLTSESYSPSIVMQGFLNVAVLAALVHWQKITPQEALDVLKESSIDGFQFKADSISWRDRSLDISDIQEARQRFFRSFGSCSFQEPVDDLKELKLL